MTSETETEPAALGEVMGQFVGFMIAALLIGTVCGAVLIMCVMNRCKKNKTDRIAKAKSLFQFRGSGTHQDLALDTVGAETHTNGAVVTESPVMQMNEKV